MKNATMIIPSNIDVMLTGITRIELTARKIKAYGMDTTRPDPIYNVKRGTVKGDESFSVMCDYIKSNGERIA